MPTYCGRNGCGQADSTWHPYGEGFVEETHGVLQCDNCAAQDLQFEDFMARLEELEVAA